MKTAASKKPTTVNGVNVEELFKTSEEVRNGYEDIRVTFKIKADATEEQLRELVQLAQKRSPVFDIVSHPVPVSVELKKT